VESKIFELNALAQVMGMAKNKKESVFFHIIWKSLLSDLAHEKGFKEFSKELLKQKEELMDEFERFP
jgi:hypothetical protein